MAFNMHNRNLLSLMHHSTRELRYLLDGFGSLFPHETVGDCLQIRGQDFTLPALLLRRLSSRLGIVEERGDLDLFPHPLARDQ